eukprot:PhF_6_TR5188/c0_g1_i1/m.7464
MSQFWIQTTSWQRLRTPEQRIKTVYSLGGLEAPFFEAVQGWIVCSETVDTMVFEWADRIPSLVDLVAIHKAAILKIHAKDMPSYIHSIRHRCTRFVDATDIPVVLSDWLPLSWEGDHQDTMKAVIITLLCVVMVGVHPNVLAHVLSKWQHELTPRIVLEIIVVWMDTPKRTEFTEWMKVVKTGFLALWEVNEVRHAKAQPPSPYYWENGERASQPKTRGDPRRSRPLTAPLGICRQYHSLKETLTGKVAAARLTQKHRSVELQQTLPLPTALTKQRNEVHQQNDFPDVVRVDSGETFGISSPLSKSCYTNNLFSPMSRTVGQFSLFEQSTTGLLSSSMLLHSPSIKEALAIERRTLRGDPSLREPKQTDWRKHTAFKEIKHALRPLSAQEVRQLTSDEKKDSPD